jgi:hypothetical protein
MTGPRKIDNNDDLTFMLFSIYVAVNTLVNACLIREAREADQFLPKRATWFLSTINGKWVRRNITFNF